MTFLYRLNFEDGQVTEDASLSVVQGMRSIKPGTIELIEMKAQVKLNDVVLQALDTPDEATSICDQLANAAAEEARNQYSVAIVKTPVEPQPEGLN